MICSIIAIAFTTGASWSCDFYQVEYRNQGTIFTSRNETSTFSVGPWTVEDFTVADGHIVSTDGCVGWDNHDTLSKDDIDFNLSFARTIIFIVCVPAYFVTIWFLLGACMTLGQTCLKAISCCYFMFAIVFPISLVRVVGIPCFDCFGGAWRDHWYT